MTGGLSIRFCIFLTVFYGYLELRSNEAIAHPAIVTRNVHLRTEPTTESDSIRKLLPDETLEMLGAKKELGYYKVKTVLKEKGYVWGRNIRILPHYSRDDWNHWIDADRDCQDTRQEVLIRDSEIPVAFKTERKCKVKTGRWTCPFSGEVFTDPSDVDIDHIVPLANAHRSGAWKWDVEKRREYANSMHEQGHLLTVKDNLNQSKGDRGPEAWREKINEEFWCEYATIWERIKTQWGLAMSELEREAVVEMRSGCD